MPAGGGPAEAPALAAERAEGVGRSRGCATFGGAALAAGATFASCEAARLRTGDALYVPKGIAHAATAWQGGVSAHLTICLGRDGGAWVDLFESALDAVHGGGAGVDALRRGLDVLRWRDPRFRLPVPVWDVAFVWGATPWLADGTPPLATTTVQPSDAATAAYDELRAALIAEALFGGGAALHPVDLDAARAALGGDLALANAIAGLKPRSESHGLPTHATPRGAWLEKRSSRRAAANRPGGCGRGPRAPPRPADGFSLAAARRLAETLMPTPAPTPAPSTAPTVSPAPTDSRPPTVGCDGYWDCTDGCDESVCLTGCDANAGQASCDEGCSWSRCDENCSCEEEASAPAHLVVALIAFAIILPVCCAVGVAVAVCLACQTQKRAAGTYIPPPPTAAAARAAPRGAGAGYGSGPVVGTVIGAAPGYSGAVVEGKVISHAGVEMRPI